jgi:hypothetical protein
MPAELGRCHHLLEDLHEAPKEPADPPDILVGHEKARFRIAQDAGLPAQVVLDLGPPERRVDRQPCAMSARSYASRAAEFPLTAARRFSCRRRSLCARHGEAAARRCRY